MSKAKIYYCDIGDYLSREAKLAMLEKIGSIANVAWQELQPNEHGDWLNQRDDLFGSFIPIGDKKSDNADSDTPLEMPKDKKKNYCDTNTFFVPFYSRGVASSVDSWVYNFSKIDLQKNVKTTLNHYNEERELIKNGKQKEPRINPAKGNWTRDWLNQLRKNVVFTEELNEYRISLYRPFTKQNHYFADDLNQERYLIPKLFPNKDCENIAICVSQRFKDGSVLITDKIPDLHFNGDTQCFPLYYYEQNNRSDKTLFDKNAVDNYIRRDGVTDFILKQCRDLYNNKVTKEDIFYYVYGLLHSPAYRQRFSADLKKMLPRIPLVEKPADFWAFSKSGRELGDLHLNYETVAPHPQVKVLGTENNNFHVDKMKFLRKDDKTAIQYNPQIKITNIPLTAYDYLVNGKSAIEWILERYQIKINDDSQIKNDPNDWATEHAKPRYILDLLLSIINVSTQTVAIVNNLPTITFE